MSWCYRCHEKGLTLRSRLDAALAALSKIHEIAGFAAEGASELEFQALTDIEAIAVMACRKAEK